MALDQISKEWKNIPSLAIGEATAKIVKKCGGKLEYIAKNFYGDSFAKEIINCFSKNSNFLYPRAKRVVSNLVDILKKEGFNIEEKIVYETICQDCKHLKKPPKNSYIIFSSPSTIECFLKCFGWDNSYKAVAIGKKTASFIPKGIDFIISPVQTLQGSIDFIKDIKF